MPAATYGHAACPKELRKRRRRNAVEGERQKPRQTIVCAAVAPHRHTLDARKPMVEQAREDARGAFYVVHAQRVHVLDGGGKAYGLADGRRAVLVLDGLLAQVPRLARDVADRASPARERVHLRKRIRRYPQRPQSHGPVGLVRGQSKEICPQLGDVNFHVRKGLGGVHEHARTDPAGLGGQFGHGVFHAKDVAHLRDAYELGVL